MKLAELVETSRLVTQAGGRLEKTGLLASLLTRMPPEEIEIAVSYLSGAIRQQRTGIGWAALQAAMPEHAAETPTLELAQIDATFEQIARVPAGKGSTGERQRLLRELLARATPGESSFLFRLVTGELRQGAVGQPDHQIIQRLELDDGPVGVNQDVDLEFLLCHRPRAGGRRESHRAGRAARSAPPVTISP